MNVTSLWDGRLGRGKLGLSSGCSQADGLGLRWDREDALEGRSPSRAMLSGTRPPALPRPGNLPHCLRKLGGLRGPSEPTQLNFRGFSPSLLQVWASSQ